MCSFPVFPLNIRTNRALLGSKVLLIRMRSSNLICSLRKTINKKAGDKVQVKLFIDESTVEIPADVLDSLLESEEAYRYFLTLTESNKKYYIDWVAEAKSLDTKVTRIVKMIQQLECKRKFWDWPNGGQ